MPYRKAAKIPPYEAALREAGLEAVPVLASGTVTLDGCAGLILLGGTDVNPSRYGQQPQAETDPPDDERDTLEWELINHAIEKDMPILAICRGLQVLNVYHGGTLLQHLDSRDHDPPTAVYSLPAHEISIEPDTQLARIAQSSSWAVNSRHHQAVERVGSGLRVSAKASDGVIEALERPDRTFVVAVQWHPEDQAPQDADQRKLFTSFAAACR